MKYLSCRKTEIIKMINNESADRKRIFVSDLETTKLPEKYLKRLSEEERNYTRVITELNIYFGVENNGI